jgi:hypothetical protein
MDTLKDLSSRISDERRASDDWALHGKLPDRDHLRRLSTVLSGAISEVGEISKQLIADH